MAHYRENKMESLLKRFIANLLIYESEDQNLKLVTITEVQVSKNYKNTIIYYSVMDKTNLKKTDNALNLLRPYIKNQIAKELTLKYIPEITFKLDETLDHVQRLDDIFDKIEKEKYG